MVDVSQYNFNFEEVVTLFIRHLDINEGLWALNVNFNFEPKNVRKETSNPNVHPGFVGVLQHLSIMRVAKSIPGITVDAARVNPKPAARVPGKKLN
jgi:hypothetical protein